MTDTRRYIISAWERAKVQYEVLAESEAEARAMYERGDVNRSLIDEHEDGEIADVTDITGHGLHGYVYRSGASHAEPVVRDPDAWAAVAADVKASEPEWNR